MSIRLFGAMRRWLTWCFLTSVFIACVEAAGSLLVRDPESALRFGEFVEIFSRTCCILLITTSLVWAVVWFFMVWLGGVRSGMALFFTCLLFALSGTLLVWLDVTLKLIPQFASYHSLLMTDSFLVAFVAATLISLVVGKISRRSGAVKPHRPASAVSVVLLAAAMVVVIAPAPLMLAIRPAPERTALQSPAKDDSVSARPIKHVVLITIDTLRQDALGCYNAESPNTPHIDAFARDGAVFTNAFSCAPWTYPAVTSILTGLAPRVHQLVDGRTKLPLNVATMAEYMNGAGYRTAAFGFNSILLPRSRLDQGFEEYNWYPVQKMAMGSFEVGLTHGLLRLSPVHRPSPSEMTDLAVEWFREKGQQDAFFWIHYFDPHMPYTPPSEFLPTDPALRAKGALFWDVKLARGGGVARSAEDRAWVRALYDSEVRYVDAQVGRLLDTLREQGLYDDALIVLTTDHGEEFWDHDRFEHGHSVFNELIHVPFLIKLPGEHRGATIDARISTRAIMPTVLKLCGIAPDAADTLLPPLVPLLDEPRGAYLDQPVFSGASLFHDYAESVLFDDMKYIRLTTSGHEMLFNLRDDPRELNSLVSQDATNLAKGREILDAAMKADPLVAEKLGIRRDKDDALDQRDILSLEALGYL